MSLSLLSCASNAVTCGEFGFELVLLVALVDPFGGVYCLSRSFPDIAAVVDGGG